MNRNPNHSSILSPSVAIGRLARGVLIGAAALVAFGGVAAAQDGGQPSPEDIKAKIREVERLMKKAEQALARSTDTRRGKQSADDAAKKLEDILEEKAQEQAGKSASELRKEAEQGSESASKLLEKLMDEAQSEAAEAARAMEKVLGEGGGSSQKAEQGIRKLLEQTAESGQQARDGIQWLLENAVSSGGHGGGGGDPQSKKPEESEKPQQENPQDEQPQQTGQKPESEKDPPRDPDQETWLAELPPQVRKLYESKDWDAIPPKWRGMIESWTKKLAKDLEEGRR